MLVLLLSISPEHQNHRRPLRSAVRESARRTEGAEAEKCAGRLEELSLDADRPRGTNNNSRSGQLTPTDATGGTRPILLLRRSTAAARPRQASNLKVQVKRED